MYNFDGELRPTRVAPDNVQGRNETVVRRRPFLTPSGARLLDQLYAARSIRDYDTAGPLLDQANRHPGIPDGELKRSAFDFAVDEGEREMAAKSGEGLVGPGFLDKVRGMWWNIKKSYTDAQKGLDLGQTGPSINTWSDISPRHHSKAAPELPVFVLDPTLNLPSKPRLRPRGTLPVGWKVY